MPVLKVKGMHRWYPAVSISSCLSLISILRGNIAILRRLKSVSHWGEKLSVCVFLFFLEWGQSGYFSVNVSGFMVGSGYYSAIYASWFARRLPKG